MRYISIWKVSRKGRISSLDNVFFIWIIFLLVYVYIYIEYVNDQLSVWIYFNEEKKRNQEKGEIHFLWLLDGFIMFCLGFIGFLWEIDIEEEFGLGFFFFAWSSRHNDCVWDRNFNCTCILTYCAAQQQIITFIHCTCISISV